MSGTGTWLKIDAAGHLQDPPELLRAAGLAEGEHVYVAASEDRVELLSRRAALKRAQGIARQFVPDGTSLVDDLILERRREAALENDDA
jgi:hypothetical protein